MANLKGKIFRAYRINQPETLNDYVRHEMTTRTPVESTPDTTVFYATDISKREITGFLNAFDPSNQIGIDEDEWIGKLKNKLEALPF